MRVLFILHMPPPVHGASVMGEYVHRSKVVNEAFECSFVNLSTAHGLEDIGKVTWQKLKAFLLLRKAIRNKVREFNPDVVYITPNSHGVAFFKEYILVQMLKAMKQRVVMHFHNKGVKTRQDNPLYNFMYRRFFHDTKVILLAGALYEDVRKYVSHDNVYICHNGIPDTPFHNGDMEVSNTTPRLLFLSNLLISKGIITLLDALEILRDKGYSFTCDIVGGETKEMNARQFEETISQRRLESCVYYHGSKYGEEKQQFLNRTDLLVFPTYYDHECFPLVLLEAMQHGKPCITTNEGGITDIVEHGKTGIIVEKKNPTALAKAIATLIDNPSQRRQMGQAGRKAYEEKFTISVFEQQLTNILTTCYD